MKLEFIIDDNLFDTYEEYSKIEDGIIEGSIDYETVESQIEQEIYTFYNMLKKAFPWSGPIGGIYERETVFNFVTEYYPGERFQTYLRILIGSGVIGVSGSGLDFETIIK